MSTKAQAEEVPFLRGMDREPEAPEIPSHETTVIVDGRDIFRGHGMMWELLQIMRRALGMASMAERGPKDYDIENDFERGMKAGAQLGGYHEAPKHANGGNSSWQKWMMTLCGVLAATGILGVVGMYGKLSAVEANQVAQQKQLDTLTQMLVNLTRRSP
jgi:hypothetical protein